MMVIRATPSAPTSNVVLPLALPPIFESISSSCPQSRYTALDSAWEWLPFVRNGKRVCLLAGCQSY